MGYDADDQGGGVVEEGEEGQEVEVGGVIIRAREGDSADGSDRRAHVRKLWERRGVPEHCPACGGRDWDRTRAGVVICIRCAEKEESA
jgi:hypothetical protein